MIIGNLVADAPGPCLIAGACDRLIENLRLHDITLRLRGRYSGDAPRDWYRPYAGLLADLAALIFRHVWGLDVRDVRVQWDEPHDWPLVSAEDCHDLRCDAIHGSQSGAENPVSRTAAAIRLRRCRDVFVTGCAAASRPGGGPLLELAGAETANICAGNNGASPLVRRAPDAPADALTTLP